MNQLTPAKVIFRLAALNPNAKKYKLVRKGTDRPETGYVADPSDVYQLHGIGQNPEIIDLVVPPELREHFAQKISTGDIRRKRTVFTCPVGDGRICVWFKGKQEILGVAETAQKGSLPNSSIRTLTPI